MLLQAASAVGLAVGLHFWRRYCRRHHQGFEAEREDGEPPAEQENTEDVLSVPAASEGHLETHAQESKHSAKEPEMQPVQLNAAVHSPPHPSRMRGGAHALLINVPDDDADMGEAARTNQAPSLQSPNKHIERLKEQVTQTTDTPWPGLCINNSPSSQKSPFPWPGLDGSISQHSTTEAEVPAPQGDLNLPGSDSPPQSYSPTWVEAEGAQSPDSPLSLSEAVSRRAAKAKRGRQRTYFNSSRSISSAESSPRAPPPIADAAASLAAHSLRSYVRSPRWAEQPGNTFASPQSNMHRGPQQSPFAPSPFATASPPGRMRILSAPEHREGSPSQPGAGARLPFSGADSLEEAPTEAGFHLDGHIEKVLSKLGDEQQQLRRYSRSFSEPNLAVHFLQANTEDGAENMPAADFSEEDEDDESQGIMTRLQSTVEATQADPQLKAALAARLNSHAETSGHSSGSNGGSQQEGPSAEERRSNQKRAREECSEPPAPIRVDVSDSGSTQAFYSASRNNYEVSIGRLSDNSITLGDNEVSGHHVAICWEATCRSWQVMDLGSLNGTSLNGRIISTSNRRRSRLWRLNDGDEIKLGVRSTLKITYLPLQNASDGFSRAPAQVMLGRALLKIPTMPSEAFAAISPKPTHSSSSSSSMESRLLLRSVSLRMEAWVASSTGREHARLGMVNEDVSGCSEHVLGPSAGPSCLFSLLDGHCGRKAADEVAQALPGELSKHLIRQQHSMAAGQGGGSAWSDAFLATDAAIRAEEGCTATALATWIDGGGRACLQAANVGDSAALFAYVPPKRKTALEVQALTEDHRLTNPSERRRLADMGIRMKTNHTRLYGLNLSRCLGDKFLKNEDLGLSAEPYVSPVLRFDLAQRGIAVMATDGLWDVMEPSAAMQHAMDAYHASGGSPQAVAEALLEQAQKRRSKDDISVIAVVFGMSEQ